MRYPGSGSDGGGSRVTQDIHDSVVRSMRYTLTQAELRGRRSAYEAASVSLEMTIIKDRIAELGSQSEPLRGMLAVRGVDAPGAAYDRWREFALEVAHFIQTGRTK